MKKKNIIIICFTSASCSLTNNLRTRFFLYRFVLIKELRSDYTLWYNVLFFCFFFFRREQRQQRWRTDDENTYLHASTRQVSVVRISKGKQFGVLQNIPKTFLSLKFKYFIVFNCHGGAKTKQYSWRYSYSRTRWVISSSEVDRAKTKTKSQ